MAVDVRVIKHSIKIVLHRQVWLLLLLPVTLTAIDIRLFGNSDLMTLKHGHHREMYHMSFDDIVKNSKDHSRGDESIRLL